MSASPADRAHARAYPLYRVVRAVTPGNAPERHTKVVATQGDLFK